MTPAGMRVAVAPAIALAAVATAVYANTLANGFVNDDEHLVLLNPWLADLRSIPRILASGFWEFAGPALADYYRPLVHLVYLAIRQVAGFRAWAYHLVNVLCHVANVVLVFAVVRRLDRASRPAPAAPSARAAAPPRASLERLAVPFTAALLFAIHPINTEAVAWVAALPELLYTLCGLGALLLFLRDAGSPRNAPVLAAGMFFLALLCKETALTLPLVFVACDAAVARAGGAPGRRAAAYVPFLLAAGVYLALRYRALGGALVSAAPGWNLGPSEVALNAFPILAEYVGMLIAPVGLRWWRPFRPVTSPLDPAALAGILAAAVVAGAAVMAWRRNRMAFAGLVLVIAPLLPVFHINAFPRTPLAERYLYLPSAGFALLVAIGIGALARSHGARARGMRIAAIAIVVAVAGAGAAGTVLRNRVWADARTLFLDSVRKSPDTPLPPPALAARLLAAGHVDQAVAQYRILAEVNPDDPSNRALLGGALVAQGRPGEAIEHLNAALALDPQSTQALVNLGIALRKQGRPEEASAAYRKALAIDPDDAQARFNLGNALAEAGEADAAIDSYREAVRLAPDNAYYRAVLAIQCADRGWLDEAVREFEEAVRLAPDEPAYRRNLDRARAMLGRRDAGAP